MAYSGRNGAVDGVSCARNWTINETSNIVRYACSATDGAQGADEGNTDYTGSYSAYGVVPAVFPGDTFNFDGNMEDGGADLGVQLANAICTGVTLNWDWETPAPLSHDVTFASTDTALVKGASTATDATVANPAPTKGTKAWWRDKDEPGEASPVSVELLQLRSATITISRPENTFSNSSQGGIVGRDVGNLDVSASLTMHIEDPAAAYLRALNAKAEAFRIGTDPLLQTDFYEFNRVIVNSIGPMTVDIEGGGLVEITLGWILHPYYLVGTTATKGNIAKPASVTGNVWP